MSRALRSTAVAALPLLAMLAACGGATGPRFLGAPLPRTCAGELLPCEGDLLLRRARDLDILDDALARYVHSVAARIARVSTLGHVPEVQVLHDASAEIFADKIIIGRSLIVRLGSEAELAAVLAHELAHLEMRGGREPLPDPTLDEESLADERGVALLARADLPPRAMSSALARVLVADDDAHPRRTERLLRVGALAAALEAAGAPREDTTRPALLAALAGTVVGPDPARGVLANGAWVVADRGVVIPAPGAKLEVVNDHVVAQTPLFAYSAWRLGRRGAREAAAHLSVTRWVTSPLGRVAMVRDTTAVPRADSRAEVIDRQRDRILQLGLRGSAALFVERGVALAVVGGGDQALDAWVASVRATTPAERAAAPPARLVLVRAPRTATARELADVCAVPAAVRELGLDEPARVIRAGELVKCTDRAPP